MANVSRPELADRGFMYFGRTFHKNGEMQGLYQFDINSGAPNTASYADDADYLSVAKAPNLLHFENELMNLPLNELEALMRQQLDELAQTENSAREASRPVELDQSTVGRLSRMDAMQSQAMSLETNRRRAMQIKRIRAALQKIEDGDYGYCDDCGEPINPKRLAIDPATPFCIKCADDH